MTLADGGTGTLAPHLEDYIRRITELGIVDEVLGHPGENRSDSDRAHTLIRPLLGEGFDRLRLAERRASRYVADEGVIYGTGANRGPWRIDPIPVVIDGAEWDQLERALAQRAELLDRILADIYGEQRLLRDRLLPSEIVFGHSGYVRTAVGIDAAAFSAGLSATDLGRDIDGGWRVIADRAQAPSGAGYAMATRRIVAQVLPRLHHSVPIAKLRAFFHSASAAVLAAAPGGDERGGRSVMLTPGPDSETAFDQAFVASLLGIPLVEADDITVQQGRPWLRASHGLVPIGAIVRRVDETWADPLDLRGDSQLGVPGLLEAVRQRQVALLNPIGAGVIENAALPVFLPRLAREILGEDLLMPSPETWWCGDDASRDHVLAHLGELVVRPIARSSDSETHVGPTSTAAEREQLRSAIIARPWAFAAQTPLPLSTAPVVGRDGLEPRRFALRVFGVHVGGEHVLMPGGLGRVGVTPDQVHLSNASGAIAKDVWVLGDRTETRAPARRGRLHRQPTRGAISFEITPRSADNLYWLGRYAERADATARLLAVVTELADDQVAATDTPGMGALEVMLDTIPRLTGVRPRRADEPPSAYLREVVTLQRLSGTLAASVQRLGRAAQQARELLSPDTWAVLADLERAVAEVPPESEELRSHFDRLLEPLLALQGIVAHGMFRDASWAFIDAGMRMERAQMTVTLLRAAFVRPMQPLSEFLVSDSVLAAGDATLTHRRRIAAGIGPSGQLESVLDLLLLEIDNPRSVAFQLDRIRRNLQKIGDEQLGTRVLGLLTRIRDVDLERLADERAALGELLGEIGAGLRQCSDQISARHFRRQAPHSSVQERWSAPTRLSRSSIPPEA